MFRTIVLAARAISFLIAILLVPTATAQVASAPPQLRMHDVGFGVHVGVPDGWVLSSAKELEEQRSAIIARLRVAGDSRAEMMTRQSANNPPIFAATMPAMPHARINMTGSRNANVVRDLFRDAPREGIRALTAGVCEEITQTTRALGGTARCDDPEVRVLAGRATVFFTHEATVASAGGDHRRLTVMIPAQGMMMNLSFSFPRAQYSDALVNSILASLIVPD